MMKSVRTLFFTLMMFGLISCGPAASVGTAEDKGETMHLVPAGEFIMGSETADGNERPSHKVYLDAFQMDVYEVTNAMYQACVEADGCTPPQAAGSKTQPDYYESSKFRDFPVLNVDWNQAGAYCEWRGGSLPTEAQWEKAARGTDERVRPWGSGISCNEAGYLGCVDDTVNVGSYEAGLSPYGMYDMAGNVWEWVADWYSETYYQNSPYENPLGPEDGMVRVIRGGAWNNNEEYLRTSVRDGYAADEFREFIGFRCAQTALP
ncbi:MAG: formylglycine-generating enzyme family protein [Anaerolineales bacterium]|nr:formylglycine-generating enzyme family protein [Anaerolineales bacterium]